MHAFESLQLRRETKKTRIRYKRACFLWKSENLNHDEAREIPWHIVRFR